MAREVYSRKWDRMTFDEQREYRDSKLSYFIRTQLYPYSPFYRKVFDDNDVKPEDIRSVEDLRKLPFTYKADIAPTSEDPLLYREFVLKPDEELIREYMPGMQRARFNANRVLRGRDYSRKYLWKNYSPVHIQFTTGRTGLPTPIMYAGRDMERMAEAGRRILELAGFGTEFRFDEALVMNAMPFAPHIGFWMVATMLERAGALSINSGGGRALGTGRILAAMEGMKATGIIGMPGYVYHLLRTAAEEERDLSALKLVLVAGERVPPGMKEKMGHFLDSLGAKRYSVLGALGFTEARKAYSECGPDGETGYHLFPDLDYIELIDPATEEPVDEGEDGELVYSCLEGQGTCVIRFRTGDFVRGGIVYEPCPSCGRLVPRLGSDISREVKVKGFSLTKIKGTLVDQAAFFTVLNDNPRVVEWQVEIKKAGDDPYEVDEINVFVAPASEANAENLKSEIESSIQDALEVKPNSIEFLPLEALVERLRTESGMKELRVVDKR
jgi:phenylacetate-coenzyme A ligase PaaK-like adenylate-forming protein